MPNPKHVRFDNKPRKRAHSNEDDDEDDVAPEQGHKAKKPKIVKEEKDEPKHDEEPVTDAAVASNAEVDSKWENLVYYYLARLKGLCDWGSESPEKSRSPSAGSFKSSSSENLEERVLKNVVTETSDANKYWAANKKLNRPGQNEVSCYMAAGYKEGKEQGVKIITRALKYGVLSGILAKEGSCYKIHPKYMKKPPTPDSTSNSEISIISSASSSSVSGDSVGKDKVKRRPMHGIESDKFQSEPDPTNIEMKRSFSHNKINIFNKKPTKHRHNHARPEPSADLIFRRPSTSKNVQVATRERTPAVSASRKHRETTRNSSRSLTREVFKPRHRSSRPRSRVQTPYTAAKRTREHTSRTQSRDQRRKGRRTKSSSSNKSNY